MPAEFSVHFICPFVDMAKFLHNSMLQKRREDGV